MAYLEFLGACETVTGSKFIVSNSKKKILLDCGMVQGHKDDAYLENLEFSKNTPDVDYCILSHSHIDHSGMLPSLVKNGYTGPIYSTPATRDLCSHMLRDSVAVFTKELPVINRMLKKKKKHIQTSLLYTTDDVANCMEHFKTIPYDTQEELSEGIKVSLHDSCHILGSSSIRMDITEDNVNHRVWYTSDIGDDDSKLSHKLKTPQDIDYLIIESTYGNKKKREDEDIQQLMMDYIIDAYKRGGKLIIPAFSVARMQTIIVIIHKLHLMGLIPDIPVYVDSPLGVKVTKLYTKYEDLLNTDNLRYFTDTNIDPFNGEMIEYISSMDESTAIAQQTEPCIVISASGMCEGGHIREHLKYTVGDKNSTVLFVGYNAEGTLGRRLQESNGQATIDGKQYRVRCKIETIKGLSAHADIESLVNYVRDVVSTNDIKNIFLVHGEEDSIHNMKHRLNSLGITNVIIPKINTKYQL